MYYVETRHALSNGCIRCLYSMYLSDIAGKSRHALSLPSWVCANYNIEAL